jgi:hypothetical protein
MGQSDKNSNKKGRERVWGGGVVIEACESKAKRKEKHKKS